MSLREFAQSVVNQHILLPPDEFHHFVNVGGEAVEEISGQLRLSEDQLHKYQHSHRGTIKPAIATKHPDGTFSLSPNIARKNVDDIGKVDF